MNKIDHTMSNEDYHGDKSAVSKSGLDLLSKSPAHFKWRQDNKVDIDSPALKKGTLIHTMCLEPEKFQNEYIVMPTDAPKRPTPAQINAKKPSESTLKAIGWWDAFNAESAGKIQLSAKEFEDAQRIQQAVYSNPEAMEILNNADHFESSVFAEDFETGVQCKCRPDIIIGNKIYDLKTTKNANARSFSYSARTYRYHVQAAFYMDLCRMAGMDIDGFGFIAVDTVDMPYQCTVFHNLAPDTLQQGRDEYMTDLKLYAKCLETGEWPGYPESYDILDFAGYAYDLEDLDNDSNSDAA